MELSRQDTQVFVHGSKGAIPIRHIIGIGRNYAEHASEMGGAVPERPLIFFKSPACAILHEEAIRIPPICRDPDYGGEQVDYEAELGVIIGRDTCDADEQEALDAVLGYCCCNDVSARWWQKQGAGGQFCRGKSFDTFCPIGPRVVPRDEIPDPQGLSVLLRLNGQTMQDGHTSQMLFPVSRLISDLSRAATLPAGTLILTGTPSGVGFAREPQVFLTPGDVVEVEIEGLGVLCNPVEAA